MENKTKFKKCTTPQKVHKKVHKKVHFRGREFQKVTKVELEILSLLTNEFLTPKAIAQRRKTKIRTVYNIIKNLGKKGLLNTKKCTTPKKQGLLPPPLNRLGQDKHSIRLHNQQFRILILNKDIRYLNQLKKSDYLNIDGNTVQLSKNSLNIYSNASFYGKSPNEATEQSFSYWNRFIVRLENDLKISLLKSRSQNIKLVRSHYSEINNELAKECNLKSNKIKVYTREDNKLWFMIDNSLNLNEAETVHPESSKRDMEETVQPFFQDLRSNRVPLPSDVWNILAEVTTHEKEIGAGLSIVVDYLKRQIKVPKPILKTETILKTEIRPDYIG